MKTYISSAAYPSKNICEAISSLNSFGFNCIELTGGTDFYPGLESELIKLKSDLGVDLLLHNYFPPPEEHFVLNIASLDEDIHRASMNHIIKAIQLSEKLGSEHYAIHAGYYKDLRIDEIGKETFKTELFNNKQAYDLFCSSYNQLKAIASDSGVKLYIENNVHAYTNKKAYGDIIPIMLITPEDYLQLKKDIDFPLLLDFAHLFVSCTTLGIDFSEAAILMSKDAHYWHISDNDGIRDSNQPLNADGKISKILAELDNKPEILTIEVYGDEEDLKSSKTIIKELL